MISTSPNLFDDLFTRVLNFLGRTLDRPEAISKRIITRGLGKSPGEKHVG